MLRTGVFFLFIFLLFLPLKAQTPANVIAPAGRPAETIIPDAELRRATFEKVWNTVNEKHFDPTFGGVDWKKVGDVYKPKALAAKTDKEYYDILQDMLGELHQSHFAVIPPGREISPTVYGEGEIGVDLQFIGKDAVITKVDADSPAAVSGLRTGFIIRKINGRTIAEIIGPLVEKLSARRMIETAKMLYLRRAVLSSLSGDIGSPANMEVLDEKNKRRSFTAVRTAYKGEMSLPLGNFSAQRVVFESKRLPGGIGYIRFNIWAIPQMPKLREAIRALGDTTGIILDLRGNPGGLGSMTAGLAGMFVKEETSLGKTKSRSGESDLTVYPQDNAYPGRIVILTDFGTGSSSEVFAAGMQGIGRAKIIGGRSAGAVLPAVIDKLPTGASFLYAVADYKSPAGVLIEGRGVTPDTEINLTRKSLLAGHDLQLEAAVKEIHK